MPTIFLSPKNLASSSLKSDVIQLSSISELLSCDIEADTLIIDLPMLYKEPGVSVVEIVFMLYTVYRCKRVNLRIMGGVRRYYPKSMIEDARSAGLDQLVALDVGMEAGSCKEDCPVGLCEPCTRISTGTLNSRQLHILQLICQRGLANKQIAKVLHISESAVKSNIGIILKTYGLRNRTQLAVHVRKYSEIAGSGL